MVHTLRSKSRSSLCLSGSIEGHAGLRTARLSHLHTRVLPVPGQALPTLISLQLSSSSALSALWSVVFLVRKRPIVVEEATATALVAAEAAVLAQGTYGAGTGEVGTS